MGMSKTHMFVAKLSLQWGFILYSRLLLRPVAFGPTQAFQIPSYENSALSRKSVRNMVKRSKAHLSIMSPELASVLPSASHLLQNCLPLLYLGFLSCFTANGLSFPTPNCHFHSDHLKVQLQVWHSDALCSSVAPHCLPS